MKHTGNNLID